MRRTGHGRMRPRCGAVEYATVPTCPEHLEKDWTPGRGYHPRWSCPGNSACLLDPRGRTALPARTVVSRPNRRGLSLRDVNRILGDLGLPEGTSWATSAPLDRGMARGHHSRPSS